MTDVIKIEGYEEFKDLVRVENEGIAVSVREFHRLLGIKKDFTNWFKYQCERLNWVEGKHYIKTKFDMRILADQKSGRGGDRKSVDYITSLDNGVFGIMVNICA